MPCYSPLRGYQARTGGFTFRKSESHGNKMVVSCGGCLGCRLDRSRMWASRIVHEASMHDENCFITLTYDREKLPQGWWDKDQWRPGASDRAFFNPVKQRWDVGASLCPPDFQKFVKKLRKKLKGRRIKYFHCGEYGKYGPGHHPHYHACIFGYDFHDREFVSEREGITTYTSKELEDIWDHGFVTVGECNYETASYTARYILKKITGVRADDHYMWVDNDGVVSWFKPEYITMSNGVGKAWYEKFKSDVFPSDEVPVPGKGVFKKAPRYYEDLLEKDDPECLEDIKMRREKHRRENASEYTTDRLYAKYRVKKDQVDQLKREL